MSSPAVDDAYAFLRAHTTGDLRFDEHLRDIRYVIEPTGRLVAPVMVAMLAAVDAVLYVPAYGEDVLELGVTLEEFDESGPARADEGDAALSGGALADRWRIHHGDPPDVKWAFLHVDAGRFRELVIDGEALSRPNPLASDEPALCRDFNRGHGDDLRALCRHFAGLGVDDPVMVAVDPLGVDVRGRFEVIRIPAPEPMGDADAARRVLHSMVETAHAAKPTA